MRFSSAEGGYSVLFPGPPTETTKPISLGMTRHMAQSSTPSKDEAYFATWGDLPASGQVDLDQGAALTAKGYGAANASLKTVQVLGRYDGREFDAPSEVGVIHARLFIVKRRMYTLSCVASDARAHAFFESFALL